MAGEITINIVASSVNAWFNRALAAYQALQCTKKAAKNDESHLFVRAIANGIP
ncbi:hypothetical protein Pvag_0066 [Pantoea vagans C9-1]|nr:hypothetical protein Pvag_0066 [Pantoea vagans C9-1]